MAHACNPRYSGGRYQEDHGSRPAHAKSKTLSQKYPTQKRASGVAKLVEHLPSKCKPKFKLQYYITPYPKSLLRCLEVEHLPSVYYNYLLIIYQKRSISQLNEI
jgi:hypothetical protein